MEPTPHRKRLVVNAELERSVIRGTLSDPTGAEHEFHGWLALHTALEAALADEDERSIEERGR
jgi:hypothetical protein